MGEDAGRLCRPMEGALSRWAGRPAAASLAALALYAATLAPTVLWGDDAAFQRRAFTLELGAGVTDHPLYLVWAHRFTRLPFGDVAFRVNLCSAVGASAGVGVVYAILRQLGVRRRAAWIGAGALAVSQAYWAHAVRAEVYSAYLALFALFLLAGVRWSLSLSVHLLGLTALAGLILLLARSRDPGDAAVGLGGLAAGLLPLGVFVWLAGRLELAGQVADTARNLLAPWRWPADAALGLGFLLYQFPLSAALAAPGLGRLRTGRKWAALFLLLVCLGSAAFAFDFQAPDRYVFYLPAYVVIAIWIGVGADWLLSRRWPAAALGAASLLAPVILYVALPLSLNALRLNPFGLRQLPYRDGNLFHLLPAKAGYVGPRIFGETVLRSLPERAVVLADHTIRQNLLYFQAVEGLRRDVEVVEIYSGRGEQAAYIQEVVGQRPVFLGAVDSYLDREEIERRFAIEPYGLIYRVAPAGEVHGATLPTSSLPAGGEGERG